MKKRTKITGSLLKGAARVAKARKTLTKRERRTPKGRFAAHLQGLLDERGWNSQKLADLLKAKEPTVRKWLRGESVPATVEDLEALGKALDTADHPFPDYRDVLPPPAA